MNPGDRFRDTMRVVRKSRVRGGYRVIYKDRDGRLWEQVFNDSMPYASFGVDTINRKMVVTS